MNPEIKQQHTPTPWEVIKEDGWDTVYIDGPTLDSRGFVVIPDTTKRAYADAAFIVRAVNSHDDLVEIAKAMLMFLQMGKELQDRVFADKIREVVAQVEGKL